MGPGCFCDAISKNKMLVSETYGRFLGPLCKAFDRGRFCPVDSSPRVALAELDISQIIGGEMPAGARVQKLDSWSYIALSPKKRNTESVPLDKRCIASSARLS